MTNIKKYTYSEILSFFTPCDPPQDFKSNCPVFTPESQQPVLTSNFKPNPSFGARPFNFVPKKTKNSDNSNDNIQKSSQASKIIDFRPQIMKEEKNENLLNNKDNDIDNISKNPSQYNKYRFRPETIAKPTSSSAPPVSFNDFKQNINLPQNETNKFDFKPQRQEEKQIGNQINNNQEEIQNIVSQQNQTDQSKNQEGKKIGIQNEKFNNNNNNRFVFRPQKDEKEINSNETVINTNSPEGGEKMENQKQVSNIKKADPWANISVKPQKKNDNFEKTNTVQNQLQKEIDNSLISANSSDEPKKSYSNTGFAPKKLEQAYEAPELPTEIPSKPKSNRKTPTNFDEIEKEEKSQKNQQQPQQQKKSLFEALLEQEKQNNNNINNKKEIEKTDDEPPKKIIQKVGFKPKQANQFYDGPSLDEINKVTQNKNQETKSGFSALMEQEKISSEREKKEKEIARQNANKVKKPSIVDILIAETIQEKSREKPKTNEDIPEEKEEKPVAQGFRPMKDTVSYEAPSIEEIENFSKQKQKKTTFTEALSNQTQNQVQNNKKGKSSFEELQRKESEKQSKAKKQSSSSNAPSFFDLLVKEEKKEKEITQSTKANDTNQRESESIQMKSTGFNPKRNKPNTGSFSEMLNQEKKLQKENQSKNTNGPASVNVKVNQNSGAKRSGNYPSFAQLINDEARLEEQRSTPSLSQGSSTFAPSKNSSFQQMVADEEMKATAAIGDFVSVQGNLPKKWMNKKNTGKKQGGRSVKTDENSDFFWGTSDLKGENDEDDDQNGQNWPSNQDDEENASFGFASNSRPTKKDSRITWLSNVLEDELGEENPWEFAESLVHKSKPEMIRFLSTITFDQQQAINIANRFFQMFPSK